VGHRAARRDPPARDAISYRPTGPKTSLEMAVCISMIMYSIRVLPVPSGRIEIRPTTNTVGSAARIPATAGCSLEIRGFLLPGGQGDCPDFRGMCDVPHPGNAAAAKMGLSPSVRRWHPFCLSPRKPRPLPPEEAPPAIERYGKFERPVPFRPREMHPLVTCQEVDA
jgi:hypothetical protein